MSAQAGTGYGPNDAEFAYIQEVVCDTVGPFIRRVTLNAETNAVVSTTNLTLAGAAYVPVGAVGLCSDCCPIVVASDVCLANGNPGVIIRNNDGTLTRLDTITGGTFAPGDIVPCPGDAVETVTAQARVLTDATPWTPADVTGTLTSLTVTGTAGLWDVTDESGTVSTGLPAGLTMTWTAEDPNTLTGPQSVTPQAGATVVAHWTER